MFKRMMLCAVCCIVSIAAHAQFDDVRKGDVVDINGVKALVFQVDEDGHGMAMTVKALRGKNEVVDLMLVAIKPEYQSKGVNALLFTELIPAFNGNGYVYAESNPELELNQKVQSQWQYFDTVQHKRRRAFKKKI